MKSSYQLFHFGLSVCISAALTGWIFVKFDIGDIFEKLSGNDKFG